MFVLVIKVRQTAGRGKIVGKGVEEERKTLEGKPQVNSVKRTCGRVEIPRKVNWNVPLHTSKSTETTKESLKAGGMVEAETNSQTMSLNASINLRRLNKLSSTHGMLPANTTHPTTHHEGFTAPTHTSSLIFPSTLSCTPSLLTSTANCTQPNSRLVTADVYFRHLPNQHGPTRTKSINPSTSDGNMRNSSSTSQPSSHNHHHIDPSRPAPYPAHLTLSPSLIRPHVLARDRLYAWKPVISCGNNRENAPVSISNADLQRIEAVIGESWSESTRQSYGSGILAFHVFCDSRNIPEEQRAPAHPILIAAFLANMAGVYSGKTLHNYLAAVRAWHIL